MTDLTHPANGAFHTISIYEQDHNYMMVTSKNAVWNNPENESNAVRWSSNNGNLNDWISLTFPESNYSNTITASMISPLNKNNLWLGHGKIPNSNEIERVSRSLDGGASWVDWSKGLLRVPVNDFAYDKSTDLIYIATDIGVFYRPAFDPVDGDGWKCYNNGLPVCIVTEIDINNCSQELIVSTYGRGIWKVDLPTRELVISTDTEWSEDMDIFTDVKVTDGATLEIISQINMSKGKVIKVGIGSKLDINGGTITNNCGVLWGGIVVEGDKDLNQIPYSYQGRLVLENGATIENAYIGIRNHAISSNGNAIWSETGGIIQVSNSYFHNNKWDVKFLEYLQHYPNGNPRDDISYFKNTTFLSDDDFIPNSAPVARMTMYRVYGVDIKDCQFEDARTGLEKHERSWGIYTIDASYNFIDTDLEDEIFSSTMKGYSYAIQSYGLENPSSSIKISGSQFENYRSIYFNGISYSEVDRNQFDIELFNQIGGSSEDASYGIYLDMCSDYLVEENDLHSNLTNFPSNINGGVIGILVNNKHGLNTRIYNNHLGKLQVAIETIGQNKDSDPTQLNGLDILCNKFHLPGIPNHGNRTDIFNTQNFNEPSTTVGISKHQGTEVPIATGPAGNQFGNACSWIENHYNNFEAEGLNYYHHNSGYSLPVYFSNINPEQVPINYSSNESCPSSFSTTREEEELKLIKASSLDIVEETNVELAVLVDGGNTALMQSDVMSTASQNSYENYLNLMQNAGFISESVLIELSKKEEGFTNSMIRDILVANPHAAKSEKIQEQLDNRVNQLPQYMRDQIDYGLDHLSPKEAMELTISSYKKRHDYASSELFKIYSKDTINNRNLDIISLFSGTGDVLIDYKLLSYYDLLEEYDLSEALINVIESYDLNTEQLVTHEEIVSFRELMLDWIDNDIDIYQLDSLKIEELKLYSKSKSYVASEAVKMLMLNNNSDYIEPIYLPSQGAEKSFESISFEEIQNTSYLKISPNPARDYINLSYSSDRINQSLFIELYSSNGKLINQLLLSEKTGEFIMDISNYESGSYTCILRSKGEIINSSKFIIHK